MEMTLANDNFSEEPKIRRSDLFSDNGDHAGQEVKAGCSPRDLRQPSATVPANHFAMRPL
jgi:hypothetical protein